VTKAGDRATRIAWALVRWPEVWVFLGPAVYLALASSPPVLAASGHPGVGHVVFVLYRGFCHQMPERSFHYLGGQMALCSRCAALAAGVILGAVVAGRMCGWLPRERWIRPRLWWVAIAALPIALDGFSQLFVMRESTNTLRVATGLILGGVTAAWAVPIVCEALQLQRPT